MGRIDAGLLSVVIVNFNSGSLIKDCLSSVFRFNAHARLEVIVVDNSQNKEDMLEVLAHFPFVKWIDMYYNAGFARANNTGMQQAKGDAILLLNPDTICLDESITRCYAQLTKSTFAAAGVQLLNVYQQPQISGSYFVKGGLNHILPIPYWGALVRWAGYKAKTKIPGVQRANAVQEVDWISGAFLMVKQCVVEKIGMMDKDFFLYGEEVEWCSRLQKAGKLVLFGSLQIIHLEGATINKSQQLAEQGYYNLYDQKGLQLMVSNHLRVRKQYGIFWFLLLLLIYTWGVLFYFVCSTFHHLFKLHNPLSEWKKIGRFGTNVFRLWRIAPTIISGKPHFYKMF